MRSNRCSTKNGGCHYCDTQLNLQFGFTPLPEPLQVDGDQAAPPEVIPQQPVDVAPTQKMDEIVDAFNDKVATMKQVVDQTGEHPIDMDLAH